jgi:hypothetical protein
MAIATSNNFYSSAIVGQPQAGADIDIHGRHTTPQFSVGFGFQRSDGNVYRYVQYGAAVNAGQLVGNLATNSNLASTNALVVATATADAVANETIKPGDVGSRYVEITLATVANNQFAGGYLSITKDTGAGLTYRIKGNTATGTPKSTTFRMELYEKIKVALDNTSDIAIAAAKYANLYHTVGVLGTQQNIVGICQAAATSDNYGWVLTKGVGSCLASTTNVGVGNAIIAAMMSGAYIQADTIANLFGVRIGSTIVAGTASQYGIVNLDLE